MMTMMMLISVHGPRFFHANPIAVQQQFVRVLAGENITMPCMRCSVMSDYHAVRWCSNWLSDRDHACSGKQHSMANKGATCDDSVSHLPCCWLDPPFPYFHPHITPFATFPLINFDNWSCIHASISVRPEMPRGFLFAPNQQLTNEGTMLAGLAFKDTNEDQLETWSMTKSVTELSAASGVPVL